MGDWITRLGVLLIAWLCWCGPAQAQVGVVGDRVPVCVARSVPDVRIRELFASPGRFDCRTPQTDFGAGDFDVLSAPLHAGRDVHLRFSSVWQDRVTIYVLYRDGFIDRIMLDGRGQSRAVALGAIMDQPLPVRRAAPVRVLWRTKGSANVRGIVLGARVATAAAGLRSNLILGALYAGFAGLCLALLIHNLALWFALRHPFQLVYCVMMTFLMLYALSSSGALAWLWPDIVNTDRMRINYLALGFSSAAALGFARSFFENRIFAGRVGTFTLGVMIGLVVTSTLVAVLAPWQMRLLDNLYTAAFVALLAAVGPVLVKAWRERSSYVWLFALAWGAPIAFGTLRVASTLRLIGAYFWLDNSTLLAMACEGLLSSLAIACRVHRLSLERDEAREQEVAARALADTDPLTGLLNRRALLTAAIGRAEEQSLAIIDIDRFKSINETIGHDGGDEVLRIVARELRHAAGAAALVARLGGEEFAVLAPHGAAPDAERLLAALRAARMPFDLSVTASIGSCVGPLSGETDWKKLYRCADRALFAAKSAGRDRARDAGALSIAA